MLISQIIKYYFVGAFVNGLGYCFFIFFTYFGVGHLAAASGLYIAGVISSFFINRKIVFGGSIKFSKAFLRLFVVLLGGYFLNISVLLLFVDWLGFSAGVVQFFSLIIVSFYFFIFNKYYIHK